MRESAEINLQKNQSLDGMVDSLKAGKLLNNKGVQLLLLIEQLRSKTDLREQVRGTLLRAVYTVRELNRRKEDRGTVRTSFSPDGNQLASGGKDKTIRLWNANGEQEHLLPTSAEVNSVAYSPNQPLLASAGEDGTVQLWNLQDLQEGKPFAAWKAYRGSVKNVRFSQDGKVLITAGEDRTAKLRQIEWRIESFDELMTRGCDWAQNYLENNPNVSESDRRLCDGIGTEKR